MNKIFRWLEALAANPTLHTVGWALLIIAGGILLARVLPRRLPIDRLHPQHQLVVRRVVKYAVVLGAVAWSLRTLGVSFSVLLGTAGLLTVAIGFAAQTSASNLISGIFLMAEQPFVIGDTIEVESAKGEVISVGLLSVRLRTVDNLLVRIPNETMLKSNVTNLTHYPVRRLEMKIGVAYGENPARVRRVLLEVANANPICLEEPKPRVTIVRFGESSVDLELLAWTTRDRYLDLRDRLHEEILHAFAAGGIEIPYPTRTITTGGRIAGPPADLAKPNDTASEAPR